MTLLTIYFSASLLATVIVTMLVCHKRRALKKKISYGTLFVSPLIANAIVLAIFGVCEFGLEFLTPDFWSRNWALGATLPVVIIVVVMCILPALGVVVLYQRRGKKDEANGTQ